jgi:hypothetical protein
MELPHQKRAYFHGGVFSNELMIINDTLIINYKFISLKVMRYCIQAIGQRSNKHVKFQYFFHALIFLNELIKFFILKFLYNILS